MRYLAVLLGIVVLAGTTAGVEQRVITIAPGTCFETRCYVKSAEAAGPTVLIVGGVHGNEEAGYRAAERIRHWTPSRGTLAVIPIANVPAVRARQRRIPGVSEDEADLNRNFPSRDMPEPKGPLAAALWQTIKQLDPDWVLDLHEGVGFRKQTQKSVGNSIIVEPSEETVAQAKRMLTAVNASILSPDREFVLLRRAAKGSLVRACSELLESKAMIIETTRKGQPVETRINQHLLMVRLLLKELGMLCCE